jgi:hypothetical protein
MEVVRAHDEMGREKFLGRLRASLTIKQRLALALCGLIDQPMRLDLLKDAPHPGIDEFSMKVHKLWVLFLRAKQERDFGA